MVRFDDPPFPHGSTGTINTAQVTSGAEGLRRFERRQELRVHPGAGLLWGVLALRAPAGARALLRPVHEPCRVFNAPVGRRRVRAEFFAVHPTKVRPLRTCRHQSGISTNPGG